MARQDVIMLEKNNPRVIIKPIDDGELIQGYHIQAWLTFDEMQEREAVIDKDLKISVVEQPWGSGYYRNDSTEITHAEIGYKMQTLNETGEYDGFSYTELFKIAVELLQKGESE